jgi:hypothetical protein
VRATINGESFYEVRNSQRILKQSCTSYENSYPATRHILPLISLETADLAIAAPHLLRPVIIVNTCRLAGFKETRPSKGTNTIQTCLFGAATVAGLYVLQSQLQVNPPAKQQRPSAIAEAR